MKTLNEQWVENGRMYKAVLQESKIINRVIDGNICHGCCHVDNWDDDCLHPSKLCPLDKGLIVKDLGPVNEEGCLAEERTGLFPAITKVNDGIWKASVYQNGGLIQIEIEVWATTRQQVIYAWNRRV